MAETEPKTPGELLFERFMKPRNLSQNGLAREIDVPPRRINEIILGKRKITADTDIRLSHYFGLAEGFWLRLQAESDIAKRRHAVSEAIGAIPSVASGSDQRASFYTRLATRRNDDERLSNCVEEVISKLESMPTSEDRPGMLLGRIQSGKTRAFIGAIARAFDRGFDVAVILTKGTRTLSAQTVARLNRDFQDEIANDEIVVFDIMKPPGRLIKADFKKKLIIVAKKQTDNLDRLHRLFEEDYPALSDSRVLLIDDEADLASIRFVKRAGTGNVDQGRIAGQLDAFRSLVNGISFLQVTATPYSLYLQPENYSGGSSEVYLPMKPAFTVILPAHDAYVGGDTYFGAHEPDDPEAHLFVPVSTQEQDALRKPDRRRIREDTVLETPNAEGLVRAVVTFVVSVCIRQWQQRSAKHRRQKYAMVIHNDTSKAAHAWQDCVVTWIFEAITEAAEKDPEDLRSLFDDAYADLRESVRADGGRVPDADSAFEMFLEAFQDDEVSRETVNSDKDVMALLDDNAELRLKNSFNIFIGGNILDRGITIPNLISFYYGRNPNTTQADTVLQHSRMYGSRSREDIAVTRLYTTRDVYEKMYTINNFEGALREAFERGTDQGVVFIQADPTGRVRPCAPNKVLLSEVVTVRPNGFYLPTSFHTAPIKTLALAQRKIAALIPANPQKGQLYKTPLSTALEIVNALEVTLRFDAGDFDWEAFSALLRYYAERTDGNVDLLIETGRKLSRELSGDKSGLSVVGGGSIRSVLRDPRRSRPALALIQQEGSVSQGWGGAPFWWPVLVAPPKVQPCVFASKTMN